jgi:hypothetical protein
MAAERHSRKMFLRSACRFLVWAGERDRTDAVEGSLRQVYAELGGMIGARHKSERHMLFEGDGPKGGFRYTIAGQRKPRLAERRSSERLRLSAQVCRHGRQVQTMNMAGTIAAQLTVLGEIPRGQPVRRNWRERRRKAGRVREQTAQFARRKSSGCGLSGGRRPLAPRTHPSIRRRS